MSLSFYCTIICGTLKIEYAMSLLPISLKLQPYERRKEGVDLWKCQKRSGTENETMSDKERVVDNIVLHPP